MRTSTFIIGGLALLLSVSVLAQHTPATTQSNAGAGYTVTPTTKPVADFRLLNVTAGGDFMYYPAFINNTWSDTKTGYGLDYTYGGSLRVDIRPIRLLALSLNGGYYGFQLNRQFKLDGASQPTLYTESQTFNQIPLYAGVKVYLSKALYVMPEVGLTWISTKVTTSTDHPTPNVNTQYDIRPLTLGAGMGLELHTKSRLMFDISLRGQYQQIETFSLASLTQTYSDPLSFVSLRLAAGFDAISR